MRPLDIAALAAVTIIFTWGSIFERVRRIYPKMLECPLCCGFWVGLAGSLLRHGAAQNPLDHFFQAALTSVVALTISFGLERLAPPPSGSFVVPDDKREP